MSTRPLRFSEVSRTAGSAGRRGTRTTPLPLAKYRQAHRITSVRDFDENTGRLVDVCAHDGIRLYAQRGRFIHAPDVIKSLAAIERGEVVAW